MQRFTDKEITKIYNNINKGIYYCGICNGRGEGAIYKDGDYIAWRHYGQSANDNNKEELQWLLQVIFKECETVSPAVWSDYHINYIPDTALYKGVDCSREHPNTFGL